MLYSDFSHLMTEPCPCLCRSDGDICSNLVRVYAQDSLDGRKIQDNIFSSIFHGIRNIGVQIFHSRIAPVSRNQHRTREASVCTYTFYRKRGRL